MRSSYMQLWCAGAKRARKPAESQPLPVLSDPATIGPEIMHHQQLLRQRNNSNPSMPPPNHYPSMTHHHSGAQQLPDPHQLRHASSAPKGMSACTPTLHTCCFLEMLLMLWPSLRF